MSQAYRTTYNINYRWNDLRSRTKSLAPRDDYDKILPRNDNWISLKDEKDDDDAGYEAIAAIYEKRNKSTYQKDYGRKRKIEKLESSDTEEEINSSALLEYGAELYLPKDIKILPPLPSSRRIYGYMSPKRMTTPLSTYQRHIGKLGYSLLNGNKKGVNNKKRNDFNKQENSLNLRTSIRKENVNYQVLVNGKELTINRSYDDKICKFICKCE